MHSIYIGIGGESNFNTPDEYINYINSNAPEIDLTFLTNEWDDRNEINTDQSSTWNFGDEITLSRLLTNSDDIAIKKINFRLISNDSKSTTFKLTELFAECDIQSPIYRV